MRPVPGSIDVLYNRIGQDDGGGAGSVIIEDVPSGTTVVGGPGQITKKT